MYTTFSLKTQCSSIASQVLLFVKFTHFSVPFLLSSTVKRRDENGIFRRAMKLEVEGRMPVGRPKKTWIKVVEEDKRKLNITEHMAEDRNSEGNSYHVQPQEWETRDNK